MFDMRRREFIMLLGGAAASWPLTARAQRQPAKSPRIGIIDDAPIWDHFRQALRGLGYIEGQNIAIEYRSAEGQPDRLATSPYASNRNAGTTRDAKPCRARPAPQFFQWRHHAGRCRRPCPHGALLCRHARRRRANRQLLNRVPISALSVID